MNILIIQVNFWWFEICLIKLVWKLHKSKSLNSKTLYTFHRHLTFQTYFVNINYLFTGRFFKNYIYIKYVLWINKWIWYIKNVKCLWLHCRVWYNIHVRNLTTPVRIKTTALPYRMNLVSILCYTLCHPMKCVDAKCFGSLKQ